MLSAKVTCVLDCFPPKSRTHLNPGLHTLIRLQNGSPTNLSKAWTIFTRRLALQRASRKANADIALHDVRGATVLHTVPISSLSTIMQVSKASKGFSRNHLPALDMAATSGTRPPSDLSASALLPLNYHVVFPSHLMFLQPRLIPATMLVPPRSAQHPPKLQFPINPIFTMPSMLHLLYSRIQLFLGSVTHFLHLFPPGTVQWEPPTKSLEVPEALARVMKRRSDRLSKTIQSYRVTLAQGRMPKYLARILGELLSSSANLANITWHLAQDVIEDQHDLVDSAFPLLRQGYT
eukprot:jgi/Psemu1/45368/gm1.45368_g